MSRFLKTFLFLCFIVGAALTTPPKNVNAQPIPVKINEDGEIVATEEAVLESVEEPSPTPVPRIDITQSTEEAREPLEILLQEQDLGQLSPLNFIRYAIHSAVEKGVPVNTIALLLLLPLIATIIAAARHIVGIRGFGILLPAALSVVFVAIGPVVGIGLFILIVVFSTLLRIILRKLRIKLQYLPRMALMLWFVVLGVLTILFLAPLAQIPGITSVSIFPVLVTVLLAEDFSKVQSGKSARTAIGLATETLVLSLISYVFLTTKALQEFALLNTEVLVIGVAAADFILGKYSGLRFLEYWRFRKLLSRK